MQLLTSFPRNVSRKSAGEGVLSHWREGESETGCDEGLKTQPDEVRQERRGLQTALNQYPADREN